MPSWLGEVIRKRLSDDEQATFGMLLAGIKPIEIAATLGMSAAGLESRLWAMLRTLEAPASEARETMTLRAAG
jgi:hypothetical protein